MTEEKVQEMDTLEDSSELVPADRRSSLVSTLKGAPYSLAAWFSRKTYSASSD
jgi:hypothetical protein